MRVHVGAQITALQPQMAAVVQNISAAANPVFGVFPLVYDLFDTGSQSFCVFRKGGVCPAGWANYFFEVNAM